MVFGGIISGTYCDRFLKVSFYQAFYYHRVMNLVVPERVESLLKTTPPINFYSYLHDERNDHQTLYMINHDDH